MDLFSFFLFMFLLLCSAFASGLSLLVNRTVAAPNCCEVSQSTSQEN
jgi:hypothetical protein